MSRWDGIQKINENKASCYWDTPMAMETPIYNWKKTIKDHKLKCTRVPWSFIDPGSLKKKKKHDPWENLIYFHGGFSTLNC